MTDPRPAGHDPESRLLRVVGVWALAAGIVNVTIGGGIFRLPSGVYAGLGAASPLAYLVCAIAMALVVTCFAEAGSRVSLTGGLYAYIEVAFGPLVGFISGFMLWAGMTAAVAAIASLFADVVGALVPVLAGKAAHHAIALAVLAALAGLNVMGVSNAARFNAVMTAAKLVPLAIVVVVGLGALHADALAITVAPAPSAVARASAFLIFAFLGVEAALVPGGEVRDPARTVPRAIAIALTTVVILYVLVQLVAQSTLGAALGDAATPVADAAGVLLGPWGRTLILVGMGISTFGYVSGMTLSVPRALYAFGRDGYLHASLARVHARYRTPHVAIAVQCIVAMVLAVSRTFDTLAIVANGATLLVYATCAIAVLQLRRAGVGNDQKPFVAPLGGLVPVLAFLIIGWLLLSLTAKEWLALSVVAAVAFAAYAEREVRRRRARARP